MTETRRDGEEETFLPDARGDSVRSFLHYGSNWSATAMSLWTAAKCSPAQRGHRLMSSAGDAHRVRVFPHATRHLTPPASFAGVLLVVHFTATPAFPLLSETPGAFFAPCSPMLPGPLKPRCSGIDDTDDYECPSPPSSHGGRHLVTPLVVTASVVVFVFLASLSIYCFIRHRRLRRRQQSLLAAEAANAGVQGDGPELAAAATDVAPEDEVVHHAWHIRTVGLDEAAIESIALTRYRAGAGTLGAAADCSVCLGEFLDGELLRLLPKCGHAFHVPCIGTWLRAHVNCPLCRADVVLDSAAAGDSGSTSADAEQFSSNTETLDHERPGRQQDEQQELCLQIDQRDQSGSPERQRRRVQDLRRVASMDTSVLSTRHVPEDKQSSKENQGRSLSGSGRWSVVSRHRRARSSLLPS